jgi:hypothetical protein
MSGAQPLDGFDFHEQALVNKEIDTESGVEGHTVEMNVYRTLAGDFKAHAIQFARQHSLIDALKQTRSQIAMHPQCDVKNGPADLVYVLHLRASASPREIRV